MRRRSARPRRRSIPPTSSARWCCGRTHRRIPTGALDDLEAVAPWGRHHDVLVASDECYAEFTWAGRPGRSSNTGSTACSRCTRSPSDRTSRACAPGFYAGDPEVVAFLRLVRQHAGLMVPGPVQAAVAVAYGDDEHVERQRAIYLARLRLLRRARSERSASTRRCPTARSTCGARRTGSTAGDSPPCSPRSRASSSAPANSTATAARDFVRIAVVQPDERLALAASRPPRYRSRPPQYAVTHGRSRDAASTTGSNTSPK